MFISKRKWQALLQRICGLEINSTAKTWEGKETNFRSFYKKFPMEVKKLIAYRPSMDKNQNKKQ